MGEVERKNEDASDAAEPTLGARMLDRMADAPAGTSTLVDDIKAKTAELIDIADGLKQNNPHLAELAITYYEIAEMLTVKAAIS